MQAARPRPASAAAAAAAAVPAPEAVEEAVPKKRRLPGKKKLLLIAALLALVLAAAGVAGVVLVKKRAAARAADGEGSEVAAQPRKRDPQEVPTFVPLDMFTVNLADREAERYAQIGVTLELTTPKAADRIKAYMPAIRNNILMVLAHKTSQQLLEREGKEQLAAEIRREALRPLGYDVPPGAPVRYADDDEPPVRRVQFSNFIIQ